MRLNNFWRVEIEKGIETISSLIVPSGQITDKGIEKLKDILIAKYMLSDEEILSELCVKNSLRYDHLIDFIPSPTIDKDDLHHPVCFADSGGMHITISLIYENELTKEEKEKVLSTSSLRVK